MQTENGFRRTVAALVAALVAAGMFTVTAGAVLPGIASAGEGAVDAASLYDEDLPIVEAAPGTVLSSRPAPSPSGSIGGGSSANGSSGGESAEYTARIFRFATRDGAGRGREVGGVVAVPDVPWEHEGPRPTVVVAPGTVGQADKCAPSETFGEEGGGQIDQVEPLLEQGFRVVVTDYIGLGAPGVHTYVNRVDQGQTGLDAACAGLVIDGLPADSPIAFWGYSQGGGATASAA